MLIGFFNHLRHYQVPCTLRELLDLIAALEQQLVFADIDQFYQLSRIILVKDECYYDKFDRAFADYFNGISQIDIDLSSIPDDWLRKELTRALSDADKAQIEALGGLDKLLDTLKERLAEQKSRHQGGNKWIGTGGTSPFGAHGYNPEGIRIGQKASNHRRAVKVWDKRQFKNLDADSELSPRNMALALRKLRQFARTGASDELDINQTISATAKNAGLLDLKMQPERHNAVKVLIFFDVGGSMDDHVKICQHLFNTVTSEFKQLDYYYFHNCIYETVWQDNFRRNDSKKSVSELINTYGRDYKVIFVGDATMGPYEILYPQGSVEHYNEEAGSVWMQRVINHFDNCIWLNPQPAQYWHYYASIDIMRSLVNKNMFPLTLDGIALAINTLLKKI